jgi:hypothetical protein
VLGMYYSIVCCTEWLCCMLKCKKQCWVHIANPCDMLTPFHCCFCACMCCRWRAARVLMASCCPWATALWRLTARKQPRQPSSSYRCGYSGCSQARATVRPGLAVLESTRLHAHPAHCSVCGVHSCGVGQASRQCMRSVAGDCIAGS